MTSPVRPAARRSPLLVGGSDLLGANRLLVEAITGTTDLVEAVHASILGWPRRIVGLSPKPVTGGIPGLAYGGVRGITRLAGNGIEQVLRLLPAASADHHPPRSRRKNWVAAKNSTRSRCPTIMFMRSRRVSVTGRMMNVEMSSIGVTMM